MNSKTPIEELLRWRLLKAEAEAPPAPCAARLLEMARPWWETWPDRFRSLVGRLGGIQVAYGHAMADPLQSHSGHPVPVLIVHAIEELEASAHILYLNIHGGRLRLRFQLDTATEPIPESYEVTFVAEKSAGPILSAPALRSVDSEYRMDTELPGPVAQAWEHLKVTEKMPFRLILRSNNVTG